MDQCESFVRKLLVKVSLPTKKEFEKYFVFFNPKTEDDPQGRSPSGRCKGGVTSVEELEAAACKLEPKVEGRILQLTPEVGGNIHILSVADI